jgi:hypothetical protein
MASIAEVLERCYSLAFSFLFYFLFFIFLFFDVFYPISHVICLTWCSFTGPRPTIERKHVNMEDLLKGEFEARHGQLWWAFCHYKTTRSEVSVFSFSIPQFKVSMA